MDIPEQLDHFRISKQPDGSFWELGRGAMGVTYKGWNMTLECPVAIKVINPQILGKPDARRRFLNEARAAAQLQHPNIAAVYHLGETADGTAYYAMEFCDGLTVQEAVKNNGLFEVRRALTIALQVARALSVAERHRIVHRDLKPSNLMLVDGTDEQLWVKIIDFGLAYRYSAEVDDTLATIGSGLSGTISFASPEQLQEKELDIRSDFYALGTCLWFMLTGESVFNGPHALVMASTIRDDPPFAKLGGLPAEVLVLLRRLLAKSADDRPRSALELCTEIEGCLEASEGEPNTELPGGNVPRKHSGTHELVLGKYEVHEIAFKSSLWTVAHATDNTTSAEVLLYMMPRELTSIPAVARTLEGRANCLRASPHPHICRVLDFGSDGDCWNLASVPSRFLTFVQLLKVRAVLPPTEALTLLAPVAGALDYSLTTSLGNLEPKLGDLWIVPSTAPDVEMLDLPVKKWPHHRVVVNALGLDTLQFGGADMTVSSMQTLMPGSGLSADGLSRPQAPAGQVARLFHQLVGGMVSSKGTLAPVSRLNGATNELLAEVRFGLQISATELIERIGKLLDNEVDSVGSKLRVPDSATVAPRVSKLKNSSSWLPWLMLPVGLAIGWLCLTLYRNHTADDPHAWDVTVSALQGIENSRATMEAVSDEIIRNLQPKLSYAEKEGLGDDVTEDFHQAIGLAESRGRQARDDIDRLQSELTDAWESYPTSYEDAMSDIANATPDRKNPRLAKLANIFLKRFQKLDGGQDRKATDKGFLSELCPQPNGISGP